MGELRLRPPHYRRGVTRFPSGLVGAVHQRRLHPELARPRMAKNVPSANRHQFVLSNILRVQISV